MSAPGDPQLELICRRYELAPGPEEMYAMTAEEAHRMIAAGAHGELEQRVFDAYKRLEDRFDVIVCEGTDFAGMLPSLDFDLNATLANQLGCPVLVVIKGESVPGIAEKDRLTAKGGEVLVSSAVKRYTETDASFRFESRGDFHFKGMLGEHEVFAVNAA